MLKKENQFMKKVSEFLRTYLSIIFGALLFLIYFNNLAAQGETLALGIIAVVFAAYYVARGILGAVLGEKTPKALILVFDILSVCLFALFVFLETLLGVVEVYRIAAEMHVEVAMGPTAWTILICNMVATLGLIGFYIVSKFSLHKVFDRLAMMFGAIFVLALLLVVLFEDNGSQTLLGNIEVPELLLYVTYTVMLFSSFSKPEQVEEAAE